METSSEWKDGWGEMVRGVRWGVDEAISEWRVSMICSDSFTRWCV